jgi:hypothetical protein
MTSALDRRQLGVRIFAAVALATAGWASCDAGDTEEPAPFGPAPAPAVAPAPGPAPAPAPAAPLRFDAPRLSETGLYTDVAARIPAVALIEVEPRFPLWSDGADKARWLYVPAGAQLDTSDPDAWLLPVGGAVIKEFRRGDRLLETRIVARTGPGPRDYWMGAFAWDVAGTDALLVPDGAANVLGTDHDVPAQRTCGTCHNGEAGRMLGVSAVQLVGSASLARLHAAGALSHDIVDAGLVGDPDAVATLGYLHANCGSCHNPRGTAWPDTDLDLRLPAGPVDASAAPGWRTTVGQRTSRRFTTLPDLRVTAGEPEESALLARMGTREAGLAMPPIATEHVDDAGVALVARWITGLSAPEPH